MMNGAPKINLRRADYFNLRQRLLLLLLVY
jgi:hypothetical protein